MKKIRMSALLAIMAALLVVTTVFADFTNGNFETSDFSGWTQEAFLNDMGLSGTPPFTSASITRTTGAGEYLQSSIVGPFPARSQTDPYTPVKYPGAGSYSAIVNGDDINYVSNTLKQTITVGAGDVDPTDGLIHVRFIYAPVFQQPNHADNLQPWFYVNLHNDTTNATLYDNFRYVGDGDPLWVDNGNGWWYMDWISVDISGGINSGDTLTLEVIAADCALGGHAGYVYIDEISTRVAAPSITANAPASVTRGDTITYTFDYNSVNAVTNAVATVSVPTGTTFVSSSLCTEAAGVMTCNIGNIAASGNGSFTAIVQTNGGSPDPVVLDTYSIVATGTNSSSGPAVNTALLTPPNVAPVAVNDSYATKMSVAFTGTSVLANDTDADLDTLTAALVAAPAHASAFTFNPDGTFNYEPENGFKGTDTFTYMANDGTVDSNVATVSINITPLIKVFYSLNTLDGWVRELNQQSNLGGTLWSKGILRLGDTNLNQQYRSFISFNASTMPASAVILDARVKVKYVDTEGVNPTTTHGVIIADIRTGFFGPTQALETADFSSAATKNRLGIVIPVPGSTIWWQLVIPPADFHYVNMGGITQFRLRFGTQDDNDKSEDVIRFASGEAVALAARPRMIVSYYIPHP